LGEEGVQDWVVAVCVRVDEGVCELVIDGVRVGGVKTMSSVKLVGEVHGGIVVVVVAVVRVEDCAYVVLTDGSGEKQDVRRIH